MRLLFLSHGRFSEEICKTAELIIGKLPEDAKYLCLPAGIDLDEYRINIEKEIAEGQKDDGILILIDLYGGTPFMITSRVLGEYQDKSKVGIVTGLNLPMVLETVLQKERLSLSDLTELAYQSGKQGIHNFTKEIERLD